MTDPLPFISPPDASAQPSIAEEIGRNLYPPLPAEPSRPEPKVVFKGAERSKTIPLQFPLSIDGVDYDAVTVKRMTAGEVSAFMDVLRGLGAQETRRFPMYFDERGIPLPDHVWNALDDDDVQTLQGEANDFLPRRFRQEALATDTPPTTSSSTQVGSATSASS